MEAVYTANVTGKGPVWPPNEDQMVHGYPYMRQVFPTLTESWLALSLDKHPC